MSNIEALIGQLMGKQPASVTLSVAWDTLDSKQKDMLITALTGNDLPYSTSMDAAMRLTEGFPEFDLKRFINDPDTYLCSLWRDPRMHAIARASTPQDAICKAFLLAVGMQVE